MSGTAGSFNLVDEPWILVRDLCGARGVASLSQIFERSHEFAGVAGDVPTQAFAITRLLLAIIRRAIAWGDRPVDRWAEIWRNGRWPLDEVRAYFESVESRFDLLHPREPFYQVADLATAKNEFRSLDLLLADVPSGAKYFTTRAGKGTESLELAEAARWLVHCQCYDISGIKSADPRDPRATGGKGYPIGVAWAGQLGGVVFDGANLFETLMLNTVLRGPDGEGLRPDDLPVWERVQPSCLERDSLVPTGTCDLLTWQSRRIRLIVSDNRAVKVLVCNGDPLESHNRFNTEYMTQWRYSEPQSKKFGEERFLPRQWAPERALWRGIEALTGDVDDVGGRRTKAAGTAHWLGRLLGTGVLGGDVVIRPHAYGLHYISQSSVVEAAIDDTVQMQLAVMDGDGAARSLAVAAADCGRDAVRALSSLAKRLAQAAGGDGEGEWAAAESAGYFLLDHEFRVWLFALGADPGDELLDSWQKTVRDNVIREARQLIDDAGQPAWLGRMVSGEWRDSSRDYSLFLGALRKALPYAYGPDPSTAGGSR